MGKPVVTATLAADASKFNTVLDSAGEKSKHFGGVLTGVAQGLGQGLFNLAVDAVQTVIGKMGEADAAFKAAQVSTTKLGVALKDNVPGWTGSTAAINKALEANLKYGVSMDDQRDALGKFVGVTHSVTDAQTLLTAAINLSAAKGIPLADAQGLVTKAFEGTTKGLKTLGIEMPKGAKGMQAVADVMKNTKGAADALADTSAGKLAASQQKVTEDMVKLGSIVDSISQAVIPPLVDAFTNLTSTAMDVWDAIQPAITTVLPPLIAILNQVNAVVVNALGAGLNWLTANVIPPLMDIINAFVKNVLPTLESAFDFVAKNILPYLGSALSFITKTVLPPLGAAFDWIVKNVLPPVNAAFSWLVVNVMPAIGAAIGVLTKTVLPALGGAFSGVADIVGKVFGTIGSIIKGVINTVIGLVNAVIGAIDAINFHVDIKPPIGPEIKFGWDGLNIKKLPYLHSGGIVPGTPGSDQLAILQAGERVIPRGQVTGGSSQQHITINLYGSLNDGPAFDKFTREITRRLRFAPTT